jgi:hypothetical protein
VTTWPGRAWPRCAACDGAMHPALAALGATLHPGCDPHGGELWCRACGRFRYTGPARAPAAGSCRCATPRLWQPSPAALDPTARRAADLLAGPPPSPDQRAAGFRRQGVRLCARPGTRLTHADMDAVEEFMTELAALRARGAR